VIVSRLKAIQYYFSDDALAYFAPNDPADLGRAMIRVYRDPQLRARLTLTAREEYQPIRWSVMKERYLGLIGQIVGIQSKAARPQPPAQVAASK